MIYKGKNIFAVIMAGGQGSRLWPIVDKRYQTKATLKLAGKRLLYYNADRIEEAGIKQLIVPVEFNKEMVKNKLLFSNYNFDDITFTEASKKFFNPKDTPYFRGDADAILQSEDTLMGSDYLVILPCDHITNIPLKELIERSIDNYESHDAIITVGAMTKPKNKIKKNFGNPKVDDHGKVLDWIEKPEEPISDLAALGIYAGPTDKILNVIRESKGKLFGHDVLPYLRGHGKLYVHYVPGDEYYWNDVGTLKELLNANMDLINGIDSISTPFDKIDYYETPLGGIIENSLISKRSVNVQGNVKNCVLGDGTSVVSAKVDMKNSVMKDDSTVSNDSSKKMNINRAILEKRSYVSGSDLDLNVIGRHTRIHDSKLKPGIYIGPDEGLYNQEIEKSSEKP